MKNGSKAFNVAWYKSDTTISINYLKAGIVDVGITYTESAERVAVQQKIATKPIYYMFRDHFLIVGPKSNPAKLSNTSDITTIFTQLFTSAENASATTPTRFLSRYDKSATNIKEADLWISIGQVSNLSHRLRASYSTSDLNRTTQQQLTNHLPGPMGNRLLNLVPPIHRLPHPGPHGRHPPRRIHPHGSRHHPLSRLLRRQRHRHLQGRRRRRERPAAEPRTPPHRHQGDEPEDGTGFHRLVDK